MPLSLSFTAVQTVPGHAVTINGVQSYACTYKLSAVASGGTGADSLDTADWIDGEIDYRLNATGQTSTALLFDLDLQDWFGSSEVGSGETQTASRQFGWTGPFTATVLLRYTLNSLSTGIPVSKSKTATLNIAC